MKLPFHGILYGNNENRRLKEEPPEFFTDLNLDQIINHITENKKDYKLDSIFSLWRYRYPNPLSIQ